MTVWTIVVAGGAGSRFGGLKQFEDLGGATVLDIALTTACAESAGVVAVVPADAVAAVAARWPAIRVVAGGLTRSESVRNGLAEVPAEATVVLVHDGARPFATAALYRAVIGAIAGGADGAVPGVAVTDTIKQISPNGTVLETLNRSSLVAVQTPQGFVAAVLRSAHALAIEATDDASVVERAGGAIVVVAGETTNRKITTRDDLAWARAHYGAVNRQR